MDDDRSTTFSVSFMGQNHFMGMVDRDKVSTIVLVNKVMKLVYKRKMTWDERFKLTVTQPWDNLLVKIIDDDELFNLWSRYSHEGLYHIDFDLEIISSPVGSVKKSLFSQTSENTTTINLNIPITSPNPSPNDNHTLPKLSSNLPSNAVMMKLVPHNSSQSRTKQNLIPGNDTNIQTRVSDDEASNSSLYEDFLDTYFRSPSCYEKSGLRSGNRTKQPTVDLAANDENKQLYHTPSDQQRQPFLNSQCLSPLLHQILPPYVPTTHDEIPISQPQIPSQPNTQKPTEPSHDCDDSVYSLSASDDDVYNQPTEPGQNANEVELF